MHVGVDIGATKTLVAVVLPDSVEPLTRRFATDKNADVFYAELQNTLSELIQSTPVEELVLAAPGYIEDGTMRRGGQVSWHGFHLRDRLQSDHPEARVTVLNDAAAAGLYEARHGTGKDYNVVLYATISTGIGTSIIIDKRLLYNFGNSEGGQMIFDPSSMQRFETRASGSAFTKAHHHPGSQEDDPAVWDEYAKTIGIGLFSMITLLQPDAVVIGGSMGEHFPKYQELLSRTVDELTDDLFTPPRIVAASRPHEAVVYGCLDIARSELRG